jgi:hypothetical protein
MKASLMCTVERLLYFPFLIERVSAKCTEPPEPRGMASDASHVCCVQRAGEIRQAVLDDGSCSCFGRILGYPFAGELDEIHCCSGRFRVNLKSKLPLQPLFVRRILFETIYTSRLRLMKVAPAVGILELP